MVSVEPFLFKSFTGKWLQFILGVIGFIMSSIMFLSTDSLFLKKEPWIVILHKAPYIMYLVLNTAMPFC